MSITKELGYYRSEPFYYEDLHAGNKIEKLNYKAYWFFDKYVMKYGKSNDDKFSKSEFLNQDQKGIFIEKDRKITITFNQGSRFEVKKELLFVSSKVLEDTIGRKYYFIPW